MAINYVNYKTISNQFKFLETSLNFSNWVKFFKTSLFINYVKRENISLLSSTLLSNPTPTPSPHIPIKHEY